MYVIFSLSVLSYTYSNWTFDCIQEACNSTTTQRYLVSFQSVFVDYTKYVNVV